MRTHLFAYGRLQSPYDPPKTAVRFTKAFVHGLMWNHGNDPALSHVGDPRYPLVEGQRIEIEMDELPTIDKEEAPEFMRHKTNVIVGHMLLPAWVYLWKGKVPDGAHLLKKWSVSGSVPAHLQLQV